jgi:hypothetical protein
LISLKNHRKPFGKKRMIGGEAGAFVWHKRHPCSCDISIRIEQFFDILLFQLVKSDFMIKKGGSRAWQCRLPGLWGSSEGFQSVCRG